MSGRLTKTPIQFLILTAAAFTAVQGEVQLATSSDYKVTDSFAGDHATYSPSGDYFAFISKENRLIVSRRSTPSAIDPQEIHRLIDELDADNFHARHDAYKKLLQYGSRIAEQVSTRLKTPASPEALERLRAIHESIRRSAQRQSSRRIRQLLFTPNERLIAVAGDDRVVSLWRTASISRERMIGPFESAIHSLAFSPNGRFLAVGTGDGTIFIVDLNSARSPITLKGHTSAIHALTFSPDSKRLISAGGFDRQIGIWDLSVSTIDRKPIMPTWLRNHQDSVLVVTVSADGLQLASSGYERKIFVWNLQELRPTATLVGHENAVRCLEFSPNGKRMISAGDDQRLRIWNIDSQKCILNISTKISGIHKISRCNGSKRVAISGKQKQVTILESDEFF